MFRILQGELLFIKDVGFTYVEYVRYKICMVSNAGVRLIILDIIMSAKLLLVCLSVALHAKPFLHSM